jgi:hypothetical protein
MAAPPAPGGVNTLRAILLGGDTSSAEARLTAIEQRLEALSMELARGPATHATRLAGLEQRMEMLAMREETTHATTQAAMHSDTERQARLERQIADLRLDHDQLAANATAFANELDQACRLRQRRVRVANRLELQRLRRQVYLRPTALATNTATGGTASRDLVAQHATLVPSTPAAASAPRWPLPAHVEAVSTTGPADRVVHRAEDLATLDATGAWHAVSHATLALAQACWILLVVLFRLTVRDAQAAWAWIRDELRGPDREP